MSADVALLLESEMCHIYHWILVLNVPYACRTSICNHNIYTNLHMSNTFINEVVDVLG